MTNRERARLFILKFLEDQGLVVWEVAEDSTEQWGLITSPAVDSLYEELIIAVDDYVNAEVKRRG